MTDAEVEAVARPRIGGHYKHVKRGTFYNVLSIVLREADEAPMVVYQGSIGDLRTWVRPMSEFMDGRFVEAQFEEFFAAIAALDQARAKER